jgi:hypothetical protein
MDKCIIGALIDLGIITKENYGNKEYINKLTTNSYFF